MVNKYFGAVPKTHNIYNLVLMVNLTAQTVEWYNPQKKIGYEDIGI